MNGVDALRVLFAPLVTIQASLLLTPQRLRRREVLNNYPITYLFGQVYPPPLISLEIDKK